MPTTRSQFNCPVCHKPLAMELIGQSVTLWCGYGPCSSVAANDEHTASTEADAFKALERVVNEELEGGE